MKVPLVPLHIVTSRTLRENRAQARAEGVTEGKAFSNKQIEMLLHDKAMKAIRMIAKRK